MSLLIFWEPPHLTDSMYPFSLTKRVVDTPIGILTLHQKWDLIFSSISSLKKKSTFSLSGTLFPSLSVGKIIASLQGGQSLFSADHIWLATAGSIDSIPKKFRSTDRILSEPIDQINYPWDLLRLLNSGIALDVELLTRHRKSMPIPKSVVRIGTHPIFISKGASLQACTLNASAGPIYIGEQAEVQEGAHIRGPFMLGHHSVVTMGARVYGPTAVGECCLIGGEVKRSLLFPYSNKAHDGYMGDSVIGSWCNWGAGTSNSNLKNTGGVIRIERKGVGFVDVGQKCGVFMGDYSRTAINSSLNSGSVIGVSAQIGNTEMTPKITRSFQWMDGSRYRIKEALEHIRNWKALKGHTLSTDEIESLKRIFKIDK